MDFYQDLLLIHSFLKTPVILKTCKHKKIILYIPYLEITDLKQSSSF